jgi:flagellar assembly protein FliH
MAKNSVYSKAEIVKDDNKDMDIQPYNLNAFSHNNTYSSPNNSASSPTSNSVGEIASIKPTFDTSKDVNTQILGEITKLNAELSTVKSNIDIIMSEGIRGKDLDKQVVEAIKDLKQFANFFEEATFRLEDKLLKTSMSIAKKIIDIEIGENSTKIVKQSISSIMGKLRGASKITIHLNPKDYVIIKSTMNLKAPIKLSEDPNVMPGGVVVASDIGNFDGNIDAKVGKMLENLDML